MKERCQFIKEEQTCYPVTMLCKVMQVGRSAYYQYLAPQEPKLSDQQVEEQITAVFRAHKRRYGVRRICAELKERQVRVGEYKCRRIMKQHGLRAIQPRSFVPRTTQSRHPYPISPNLLQDRPAPLRPDEVWVGDITYLPLAGGRWTYLAVWMDLYSRRIVGWQMESHMREELVITALQKALQTRHVKPGLIVHSDRGGQYAGSVFRKLLVKRRLQQSMSRADDPYDNAAMESFFSRLKAELLDNGLFDNLEDARTELFEYIEMYYNTQRKHSSLNYQSPMQHENHYFYSLTKQVNCT
ncbi:MAG: IS3 family transposase [Chitinophagaceae bacterium]|nr:MAG: IS3 family transposase [Chitinophagaceae bacterium]